jgi:hypothetical protein
VEKLITVARTRSPQIAIRYVNQYVTHKNASRKVMEVLKPRYATRSSGFTRIVALGARKGDGAELVTLELLDRDVAAAAPVMEEKKPKKPATAKKTKSPTSKKTAEKSSDTSESSQS